jgi:DNA-binding MarR family transcriptional regulator
MLGPPDDPALARALLDLRARLDRLLAARPEGVRRMVLLTAPQQLTLTALGDGPLAMSELAGATGVAVSTATRMVQGLRRAGLVAPVEVAGGDARRRYVAITPAGREASEREGAARLARVREVLERLDPGGWAALLEGMRALTDAFASLEREVGTADAADLLEGARSE